MNAKNALGRGLDALLSTPGSEPRRVLEVEIHRLKPNPRQPRARFEAETLEDLAQSIKSNGILQPILVRPSDGKYEIIAGERRWRAAQRAGLQRVPVLVREAADAQVLELALVENIQREDLNPVEEAHAYRVLIEDLNLSQEEVARRVGKERATVANTLRLLHLSQLALAALEAGQITTGHAKAILSHKKHEEQDELLEAILKRGLSVREAEAFRRRGARRTKHRKPVDADTAAAAERLAMEIGVPVEIRRKGRGGEVALRFKDEEELQRLFEKLYDLRGRGR
jgi:ParB family transcriptional regulator, chromosome partitioning protein